ncbi:MAG: thrombospondin type 3 repeat-containing protein [Candidatus Thalassarchaeaceae archaeon]
MDRYLEPSFRFVPIFIALLMILGPMTGMIGFSNDFTELSNEEKWVGPPGVGTSNATIITTTYLNGSHSYDDLYIGCSTTSSCGSIVSNGSLILTVNTLTVDAGASIISSAFSNMTQGPGTSVQLSSSWRGNGAGGAGHYGSGGSGGGVSSSNGGSSYGVGNETGSTGGSINDSNGNLVSSGGIGGGHIVVFADSIEISGIVTASGNDGDPGYRYNNGSGTGGPGSGGGSGGSIVMWANDVTISGQLRAEGGDGGDGEDGDCLPGSACLFMYDGGDGGGGGSGGIISVRANSTNNLNISTNAIVSSSDGSGGSAGAPYGTGAAGVAGTNGSVGSSSTGIWAGWSSGSGGGSGPASSSTPDAYEPNDSQSNATWGNASISTSTGLNSTSWSGLTIHSTTDTDWFCFWINQTAQFWFNITFIDANGDIDLRLYDSGGNQISSSTGVSNSESVTQYVTSSAFYCAEVYGYSGAINYYNATLEVESTTVASQNDAGSGQDAGQSISTGLPLSGPNNVTYGGYLNELSDTDDYYSIYVPYNSTISATMTHATGLDFDLRLYDPSGTLISTASSSGVPENVTSIGTVVWPAGNYSLRVDVYPFSLATNTGNYSFSYWISGASSFAAAPGNISATLSSNLTYGELELSNLSTNSSYTYQLEIAALEYHSSNNSYTTLSSTSSILNVTQSNFTIPVSSSGTNFSFPQRAGTWCLYGGLSQPSSGSTSSGFIMINESYDCIEVNMLDFVVLNETAGFVLGTNLTAGDSYRFNWTMVDMNNYSTLQSGNISFTPSISIKTSIIPWNPPNSGAERCILMYLENSSTNAILDSALDCFTPEWPRVNMTNVTYDRNSTTNEVRFELTDLNVGESYQWSARLEAWANGTFTNVTSLNNQTIYASNSNMSSQIWNYTTPNASAFYCAYITLSNSSNPFLDEDGRCFQLFFDDDWDGVWNEDDLCPNTSANATVDIDGCDATQRDSDGDGYVDASDAFPFDATQWSDGDGDGFGDNPSGNNPDAFPTDSSQWSDGDGDGYGDNPSGNNSDAFPTDPNEWEDSDGDGYGDNGDFMPNDPSQWIDSDEDGYGDNSTGTDGDAFPEDSTQWSDQDGDGYGDNPQGTTPDEFPNDPNEWVDTDGDGYGDNGDFMPNDPSQWIDSDGDGYGDNLSGTNPDVFPNDGTQWSDSDGDGYGDNPQGNLADAFPNDSSQWSDVDSDGYGDNQTGNYPDNCPNTPVNARPVDSNGCHESELDTDEDGVTDDIDLCPQTPDSETADSNGCSPSQRDTDNDGVTDDLDDCPQTPNGESVNSVGCGESQLDDDLDGVMNDRDNCPSTDFGLVVDGYGCATNQLDTDGDGVNDDIDACISTIPSYSVDEQGCADYQKDSDGDSVMDDKDLCANTPSGESVDVNGCGDTQKDSDNDSVKDAVDSCPGTPGIEVADADGCSPSQKDSDVDGINNAIDECPQTNSGSSVNNVGCADYERDTDGDGVLDIDDFTCPSTPINEIADLIGCGPSERDTDGDLVVDASDICPNTNLGASVDSDGCSVSQRDTDGDGIKDDLDIFPNNANEWDDSDGDGVGDNSDAYPDDPAASLEGELDNPIGLIMIIIVVTILALGGGALLFIRSSNDTEGVETLVAASEQSEIHQTSIVSEQTSSTQPQPEQFVDEQGNHWIKQPDGTMLWWNGTDWQQVDS